MGRPSVRISTLHPSLETRRRHSRPVCASVHRSMVAKGAMGLHLSKGRARRVFTKTGLFLQRLKLDRVRNTYQTVLVISVEPVRDSWEGQWRRATSLGRQVTRRGGRSAFP